jgi:hypothetical protein
MVLKPSRNMIHTTPILQVRIIHTPPAPWINTSISSSKFHFLSPPTFKLSSFLHFERATDSQGTSSHASQTQSQNLQNLVRSEASLKTAPRQRSWVCIQSSSSLHLLYIYESLSHFEELKFPTYLTRVSKILTEIFLSSSNIRYYPHDH